MATESFDEISLQKEYKNLLSSIKPLINKLDRSIDATLCLLWLTKLDGVSVKERPLRNDLLSQLKDNVVKKRLSYPFSAPPPEGSLTKLIQESALLTVRSTTERDFPNNNSSQVLSPDNGIKKYQERTRKCKMAISQYQNILKNILQSSKIDIGLNSLPPIHKRLKAKCNCNKSLKPTELLEGNLLQRIENLEKENQELYTKVEASLNYSKKDKRRETNGNESTKHKLKKEIEKIVLAKDKIISRLEDDLKNQSHSIATEHTELAETLMSKCNDLEAKYKEMLENSFEQHRKEREADRQTIEKLQAMLLTTDITVSNV